MLAALLAILQGAVSTLRTHRDLLAEIAALRQQLAIFKRTVPRPDLRAADRLFWVTLRRVWSGWRDALVVVSPETLIAWHRQGFRRYWSWISRRCRPTQTRTTNAEIRELVRRIALDNSN